MHALNKRIIACMNCFLIHVLNYGKQKPWTSSLPLERSFQLNLTIYTPECKERAIGKPGSYQGLIIHHSLESHFYSCEGT